MARAEMLMPDLKLSTVARLLGFASERELAGLLDEYLARGMPAPDPITRRIDPVAFERWRRLRAPHLFPELCETSAALDPRRLWAERRAAWRGDAA
ncbi:hypothetical protein [Bosea sp. TND4EK4]|uniref:hypothetical protein n=1 Tax=Bosea sp. TND4EK4 TaxID=1907408 RepID=UPI000954BAC8|nr:hypothetical protein [Bosea sp. TND4EK4]SIQ76228.1 hypothetical protein SAMN05880592_105167 [Bosea sp. TND4EK4]